MRNAPRRRWHLAPSVDERPPNESARLLVVTKIAGQRFQKERHVLPEGIKLIAQWLARAQKVTANFTIDFDDERRFRFVIGVISGEKIGEQLSIFVNRVDRLTQKPGLAAQFSHRLAIGTAVAANRESVLVVHQWPFLL